MQIVCDRQIDEEEAVEASTTKRASRQSTGNVRGTYVKIKQVEIQLLISDKCIIT